MSTTQLVLDQVDIVTITVRKTTGRRKLQIEDMILGEGSKLPPQDLASLGAKQTVSREILKVWDKYEARLRNALASIGVPILNGSYAVAKDQVAGLTAALAKDRDEAIHWRDHELPLIFHDEQEKWFKKHPEWEHILRPAAPTLQEMQASMRIGFSVITNVTAHQEHAGNLHDEVADLGDRLLDSVAGAADAFFRESQKRPERVFSRPATASFLSSIRRKLKSFAFLEPAAAPAVKRLDEHLAALPKKGRWIDAKENNSLYWQLHSLVMTLRDPSLIRDLGQGQAQTSAPNPAPSLPSADASAIEAMAKAVVEVDELVEAHFDPDDETEVWAEEAETDIQSEGVDGTVDAMEIDLFQESAEAELEDDIEVIVDPVPVPQPQKKLQMGFFF